MNLIKIALVTGLALGLSTMMPRASLGFGIVVDASKSGIAPTISDNTPGGNPFFFRPDFSSLWGPSTVTSIGPNAWEINLIFAGGDSASFGSNPSPLDPNLVGV